MDRIGEKLKFQQAVLGVRAYRQGLIASNVANADTPHYKARDVEFKDALANALGGTTGGRQMTTTHARHLGGNPGGLAGTEVKYRTEYQSAVDGNTVDLDGERARYTENAVQLEASMNFVSGKLRTLLQASQDR